MSEVTWDIRPGHVIDVLRAMDPESVQCVVTSPPYWSLRDYGTDPQVWCQPWDDPDGSEAHECECSGGHEWTPAGVKTVMPQRDNPGDPTSTARGEAAWSAGQAGNGVRSLGELCGRCDAWRGSLGLEPTWQLYVAHLVAVFREVRRVLRKDGTAWLNLGDSYVATSRGNAPGDVSTSSLTNPGRQDTVSRGAEPDWGDLKPKDLVGIPWRVAFALQDDGWYMRRGIVWAKPNPMPESVEDRPTSSHEFVFLLARSPRYFYDHWAVKEPLAPASVTRITQPTFDRQAGGPKDYGSTGVNTSRSTRKAVDNLAKRYKHEGAVRVGRESIASGNRVFGDEAAMERMLSTGRNQRDVWWIATEPSRERHFAMFPRAIPDRCIRAGTPEAGCCPTCRTPFRRVFERVKNAERDMEAQRAEAAEQSGRLDGHVSGPEGQVDDVEFIGWAPTCGCAVNSDHADDFELIESPVSEGVQEAEERHQRRMVTGRRGLDRTRRTDEGVRTMTRYEQRAYAAQLKALPASTRKAMATMAGGAETFAHYMRTDRSGARAIPERLLEEWIGRGHLTRVELPEQVGESVPAVVMDPFLGSGTTGLVAVALGRSFVGIELSEDYARGAERKVGRQTVPLFAAGSGR